MVDPSLSHPATAYPRRSRTNQNVLVIGASGRTGVEIIRHLAGHVSRPNIFAVRSSSSEQYDDLDLNMRKVCSEVIQADMRSSGDMEQAILKCQPSTVIVSLADDVRCSSIEEYDGVAHTVGSHGADLARTDLRYKNARILVDILSRPEHQHVHVVILSRIGAGPTKLHSRFGKAYLKQHQLRFVMTDHTLQERAFLRSMKDRVIIIRPTEFTDAQESSGMMVQSFGDYDRPPTDKVNRTIFANWFVDQMCGGAWNTIDAYTSVLSPSGTLPAMKKRMAVDSCASFMYGKSINITGAHHRG
mmetsp:Transcript_14235/g.40529  ORF Transcript_14235/g.40529 Transcript_14235/m.40529 type:complete len:301 (+) Transcript_14235:97-999(+)